MKNTKKLLVGIIPILCIGAVLCAKPITKSIIVESNTYGTPANSAFNDEKFYECVVDAYNNENGTELGYDVSLTDEQLESITELKCSGRVSDFKKINDITGIEKMVNLTKIIFGQTSLHKVDLSHNKKLTYFSIDETSVLASIDLSQNTALTHFIDRGGHTDIDLSNCSELTYLELDWQWLSEQKLDFSKNTKLETLNLKVRNLESIDLSKNTALTYLEIYGLDDSANEIENIDLGNNVNLTELYLKSIPSLKNVNISNNTKLVKLELNNNNLISIDLENDTKLKNLDLSNNQLTSIDLSNQIDLEYLYLNDNNLSNIDVTKNINLYWLKLSNNQLTTIDLSQNVGLFLLYLDGNQLSNLDLSNNNELRTLYINNNKLSTIDLSNISELSSLRLNNNQLENIDLSNNTVLSTLFLNDNQLSSVKVFSGNKVITLNDLDLSNNNFNFEKYIYREYNFLEMPNIITLPQKVYEFLSISTPELCNFNDSTCTFNNTGINNIVANYKTISEHKKEGYYSFDINYKFYVIDALSEKYTINNEKDYIYTFTDTDADTIFNNISVNELEEVNRLIENNKYIIKHGDEILKEFNLVNYSSEKYDLNQYYININDNDISSFLNNISCTNCNAYVYDGTNNFINGEFKDNYKLRIMYNDEILKEYELKYIVNGIQLNTNNLKLNLDSSKFYELIANVNPSYATNKSVTWESSNPSVATVDDNGLVTAKSLGNTTITVKTVDGGYTDTCNVEVTEITTYKVTYKDGDNTYTDEFEENEDIVFKSNLEKAGYKLVGWKYNNKDYKLTDKLSMPSNDIELTAIWELVIPDIKNYSTGENNITGISLKTDVSNLNLGIDSIYDVKISKHDGTNKTSGLIGTGDKIKIFLDNQIVSEYEVIIKGDVTGTGTSTVSDVAKLYQYLKKKIDMDECFIKAGNVVNSDDTIKVNDVAKLYQFIKGKINNL